MQKQANMCYFDDLEVLAAEHVLTSASRPPGLMTKYSIGLILRAPAIKFTFSGSREYASPFAYWGLPGESLSWGTRSGAERENLWCVMLGKRAERMAQSLRPLSPDGILPLREPDELIRLFTALHERFLICGPGSDRKLTVCLERILCALCDEAERMEVDVPDTPLNRLIGEIVRRIREAPGISLDYDSIAAKNHISPQHFRRCFRRTTGRSLYDFVLYCRLEHAKKMLKGNRLSIKEISDECGFGNPSDFTRFFRKHMNLTPTNYRQVGD